MIRPRPVPHHSGTGNDAFTIWGDPAKVKLFFPDLSPASAADPVPRSINVPARSRRQYPGDATPVRQQAHTRKVLIGGGYKTRATPGKPFTCEMKIGTGTTAKTKVYQFTVVGPFRPVRIMAMEEAATGAGAAEWVLRSPGGRGYPIKKVGGAAAQASGGS